MQLHEVVGKKGKEKETKTTTNSESNRIGIQVSGIWVGAYSVRVHG